MTNPQIAASSGSPSLLYSLKRNRFFKFLASLKLAVVLLVALAGILAAATYYESLYDAKTAQYMVYGSTFFAAFLTLLAVNLFCSTLSRYPWRFHQTGFVLTHFGIIVILLGSLVTMKSGVDGSLMLGEGESKERVTLPEPILYFGRGTETLQQIEAEFRWNPPRQENPISYPLGDGLTAVVDRYYHHAEADVDYVEADEGVPALRFRLSNPQVDLQQWLTTTMGTLALGPATVKFSRLPDNGALARFLGGIESGDRGRLQLLLAGRPYQMMVGEASTSFVFLGDSRWQARIVRYLPHAVVEEQKLVSRSQDPINPAVEVELLSPEGGRQSWLLFARLPDLSTRTSSSGPPFEARMLYEGPEQVPVDRSLELALASDQKLYYRIDEGPGARLELGRKIATGWMDLEFEALEFVARGKKRKQMRRLTTKKQDSQQDSNSAIRVRLVGAPEPGPYWLERGDILQVASPDPEGRKWVLGYGYRTVKLGFKVKLLDFEVGFDPGTSTPATYESRVEVDGGEHLISMNSPLQLNGYRLFQASYAENEKGEPIFSVFSVARDPGIGLKYVGSIFLVLGIAFMFYVKPYLLRKEKESRGR